MIIISKNYLVGAKGLEPLRLSNLIYSQASHQLLNTPYIMGLLGFEPRTYRLKGDYSSHAELQTHIFIVLLFQSVLIHFYLI